MNSVLKTWIDNLDVNTIDGITPMLLTIDKLMECEKSLRGWYTKLDRAKRVGVHDSYVARREFIQGKIDVLSKRIAIVRRVKNENT